MNHPVLAPPRTPPQARLVRIARFARALVLSGAVVLCLSLVAQWVFPDWAGAMIEHQTSVAILGPLTARTRAMVLLWEALSVAVTLAALFQLWQLFGEYLQSRVFSARALRSLRGFARWVLAAAILAPIHRAAMSVIVTWQNGHGKRQLNLDLSSDDFLMLLLGVVLLAISSVMAEAARIAEDNEGFV